MFLTFIILIKSLPLSGLQVPAIGTYGLSPLHGTRSRPRSTIQPVCRCLFIRNDIMVSQRILLVPIIAFLLVLYAKCREMLSRKKPFVGMNSEMHRYQVCLRNERPPLDKFRKHEVIYSIESNPCDHNELFELTNVLGYGRACYQLLGY